MNILKLVLVLVVLLGAPNIATACTCGYLGVFENYSNTNPIVVRATVLKFGEKLAKSADYYSSLTAKVTETYKGRFPHSTIILLGGSGRDCRNYIDMQQIEIGEEYLFSLSSGESAQAIGGCGESFVKIEGTQFTGSGHINGSWKAYSSDLEQLISKLRRM